MRQTTKDTQREYPDYIKVQSLALRRAGVGSVLGSGRGKGRAINCYDFIMEISAPRYRAELHRLRGVQGEQRVLIGSRPQDIVHAGRRFLAQGFWLFFLLPRSDCEKNLLRLVKLGEKKENSQKIFYLQTDLSLF